MGPALSSLTVRSGVHFTLAPFQQRKCSKQQDGITRRLLVIIARWKEREREQVRGKLGK